MSIVGARPQFVKLASLSKELRKKHQEIIVHTGQHYDTEMSESFFRDLDIAQPDYNLAINAGRHGEQTGRMLIELEKVVYDEKPDVIIVFGDTNTTLAGAMVAAKLQIPTVHVEAGLRSFNRTMPEEINRIVADHTSDYLFAPTETAMRNLEAENLMSRSYLTGDIMVDSLAAALEKSKSSSIVEELALKKSTYYLLTLHRPYNVDDPGRLSYIVNELGRLSDAVVFPVHPRTMKIIERYSITIPQNVLLIKPVGYLNFVRLQADARKIITDSGGVQKEAYILKKPCITLRSETEWVETVESGWNLLINPSIEQEYARQIEKFTQSSTYEQLFGGDVALRMVAIIDGIST
ncbi:MAG: UDP-N-acetylglucosamine 2-epimerase (non-hydrolyzing) [Dehalococcoidales bacterium]|nr:UDP-N-acetylglucosamine 2-epimerase (non-hydrolyzing) [Dehalococcoidales bacterium]